MENDLLSKLLNKAAEIAKKAGANALQKQAQSVKVIEKEMKGDFATDIDLENEKLIMSELKKIQPQFPVFTEEEYKRPDVDIYWVVDPLDGTKNYYHGLSTWSVNISLYDAKNQDILLGVVFLPVSNHLFSAYKNGGAFLNGNPISPSKISDPAEAKVYIEVPYVSTGFLGEDEYQTLRKKIFRIRTWGLGAALCYVASGAFEAFYDFSGTTRDYDIFASLIIAKESGCRIVQFETNKDFHNRIIKVTNNHIAL